MGNRLHEVTEDFPEVAFILFQHLLWLIQGVIAVAQDVDEPRVQTPPSGSSSSCLMQAEKLL